jgi:hypothetical protein
MSGYTIRLLVPLALAAAVSVSAGGQTRDAGTVLREMRAALGGDAALDAIQTLSVNGDSVLTFGMHSGRSSLEVFALFPEHYLEIRRHHQSFPGPAPMEIESTNYLGFRVGELIRRFDSTVPLPPPPETPARLMRGVKHDFARLAVALFGRSFTGSPFVFSYVGPDTVEGQPAEVLEMQAPDGFVMRLYVNRTTHLPALIAWQDPPPLIVTATATSTAVVRGGQVVSQSAPTFNSGPPPPLGPDVMWRTTFSDFKVQDGLNWPHRVKKMAADKVVEDVKLGKFKINPKIDPRRFDIGR